MADIKLFFGMTERVNPKEFYFDGLVMERILSYIPKPKNNTFKVGSFYYKMMRVDRDTLKVIDDYFKIMITKITKHFITFTIDMAVDRIDKPFTLKKKKKIDEEGEYVEFVWSEYKVPSEQRMAFIQKYVLNSEVFRPSFLLEENPKN
jgi:hypothetical protein